MAACASSSPSSQIDNGSDRGRLERDEKEIEGAGGEGEGRKKVDVLSPGIYNARGKVRRLQHRYASFVDDNV